jgi:alcohol dehydrogenase (cytochrome c)
MMQVHDSRIGNPQINASQWLTAQGNMRATRFVEHGVINAGNVESLSIMWNFPLHAESTYGAMTSNPIVTVDSIYIVDQEGNVHAIDRASGGRIWRHDFNVSTGGPNGLAIAESAIVSVLGDTAEVVSLTRDTGEEQWRVRLSKGHGLGVTVAPFVVGDRVFVGTAPGGNSDFTYHPGAFGSIYCLDLQSGKTIWEWRTVADDAWGNPQANGGGGVWYPPSYGEDGTLYFGVGNPAPFPGTRELPNGSSRPGPNDYANCLVALNAESGSLKWHINVVPFDLFDHDNQLTPLLITSHRDGRTRDIVITSGKHGFVIAADARTGTELWRTAVGHHQNDDLTELPESFVEVSPGLFGGVLAPMAASGDVVIVAALDLPTQYNKSGYNIVGFDSATTALTALNIDAGNTLWETRISSGVFGAGPTISGDLVFVGTMDGMVRAFRVDDGRQMWSLQLDAGINAPFAIAGDTLYVAAGAFLIPSVESTITDLDAAQEPGLYAISLGAPMARM